MGSCIICPSRGRASPDLSFLPIAARELTLHGLDRVSGEQICQWEQHITRRTDYDGRISGVSGESYEDYVETHILAPLGMRHTTAREPLPRRILAISRERQGRIVALVPGTVRPSTTTASVPWTTSRP